MTLTRVLATTILAIALHPGLAAAQGTATDLGALTSNGSAAVAVNDAGDAVGYSFTADFLPRAVLFKNGQVIALGPLCAACTAWESRAKDINNAGVVVGEITNENDLLRGFTWQNGVMTELPPLPGDARSSAAAINDAGVVAGWSLGETPEGFINQRAVRWVNGVPEALALPANEFGRNASLAVGINSAGAIVGQMQVAGSDTRGFVWSNGGFTELDAPDGACGAWLLLSDINDEGEVVGLRQAEDCSLRATKWVDSTPIDLGSLYDPGGSSAYAVNAAGFVAGASPRVTPEVSCFIEPVLFHDGVITLLGGLSEPSGCAQGEALGISDRYVVGYSYNADGEQRATLWLIDEDEPSDEDPPSVTVSTATGQIWPPNGRMVAVAFTGTIGDAGSGVARATFSVADEYGQVQPSGLVTINPDGSFIVIVSLEARRRGNDRDGRTYTLTVTATDNAGNSASASASTGVLHDQRK
jgi:probable HAF family extracellular repeat protein